MAKAIQVTAITRNLDGSVGVEYKFGDPPLNGVGISSATFGSEQALIHACDGIAEELGEDGMLRLLLALSYVLPTGELKQDSAVIGRTLTLDPRAAGPQPIRLT